MEEEGRSRRAKKGEQEDGRSLLAGGLGVISLELEIPCSHLQGRGWQRLSEQRSAPGEPGGGVVSLPGSLTGPVSCRQPGFGGPVLVSRRVAMGTMSPGEPWDPQSSEIWTHLRHRNRLILIGNKRQGNLLPWVQKCSFI